MNIKDPADRDFPLLGEPNYCTYKFIPTQGAPALEVDGVLMHRIEGVTPDRDAAMKVKAIGVRFGRVLDICTGLGYSAIAAARRADFVVTVEFDPGVLATARKNPASHELFNTSHLHPVLADANELVLGIPSGYFGWVLHDPPRFSRAGELYGAPFYTELYRVLKFGGKLFHYVGAPGSKYRGKSYMKGVVKRLNEVGFRTRIEERLQGVIGVKRR